MAGRDRSRRADGDDEDRRVRSRIVPTPADEPGSPTEEPLGVLQALIGNRGVQELMQEGGQPVPAGERAPLEEALGRSFAEVRLHTGPAADAAADDLGATAFTVGTDVYVHSDAPPLDSPSGRVLLAEELAHVVQGVGTETPERITRPDEQLETDAKDAAAAALTEGHAQVARTSDAAAVVARDETGAVEAGAKVVLTALSDDERAIVEGQVVPALKAADAALTATSPDFGAALAQIEAADKNLTGVAASTTSPARSALTAARESLATARKLVELGLGEEESEDRKGFADSASGHVFSALSACAQALAYVPPQ